MSVPCPTCDPTGRGRSCPRLRCYCGHAECWAAAYHDGTRTNTDRHPTADATGTPPHT